MPEMEAPPQLLVTLEPYQKQGLAWMVKQEQIPSEDEPLRNKESRGGILADEMGLGKTVQSIALILANRPERDIKSDKIND